MRLEYHRHYLHAFFEPASVAIIGATHKRGKAGEALLSNMLAAGYRGTLYAVNPKYAQVHAVPCFSSVARLPGAVDLAVIATPAPTVAQAVEECGRKGIRAALIVTAGFSESGLEGVRLEREVLAAARRNGMRLIGPDCLGLVRPHIGFNAAFTRARPVPGSLALVSQSGAVCAAMLDWAEPHRIGFSSVVCLGGSVDMDFGEIIDYLSNDPKTEHILLYIERIHDARRFLSSLRGAARTKPVILMKTGRHPLDSRTAVSHTGAAVGMDDVFEAAVRRVGVVRVSTVGQLVAAADALAARIRPGGDRLAVITNGGGPGVMAADRAADLGLPLARLGATTVQSLRSCLPGNWLHGNPIDLIGDAGSERYRAAVAACLADEGVDGLLVILAPQAMTDAEEVAHAVIEAARGASKPVVACWMGEASVAPARELLKAAGIPTFRTPDPAVEVFAHVSSFFRVQQALLQAPPPLAHRLAPDLEQARSIIERSLRDGEHALGQADSKALLAAFHIPVTRTARARSAAQAAAAAQDIGFPVAMKIDSPDITHKTDAGGVRLNLTSAIEVLAAYREMLEEVGRRQPGARLQGVSIEAMAMRPYGRELMVGVLRDEVFGPAIAFGAGGAAVDVHRDRSVALPPLNAFLAAEMIRGTRVARMLETFRGMPAVDRRSLEQVLLRLSEMVCELPQIAELDINPLLVDESGAVALDARVIVREAPTSRARYAHMAVHPYPAELVRELRLPSGAALELRPIRPEDAEIEAQFVRRLSDASRYSRFMSAVRELTPSMVARFTQIDYDREMALIAVAREDGREVEVGVARYVTNPDGRSCEFAIAVADEWQRAGLGRRLLAALCDVARRRGITTMLGYVLAANHAMLALCERLGFEVSDVPGDPGVKRELLRLCSDAGVPERTLSA
jgi:acetyltransferase